jgi:hypothetical protein
MTDVTPQTEDWQTLLCLRTPESRHLSPVSLQPDVGPFLFFNSRFHI